MKIAFKLMLLLALFNLIGCNTSIEERIEKEFLKYAEENFDDPDAIEKITAIDKSESLEIEQIIDECDSLINSYNTNRSKTDSCAMELLVRAETIGDSTILNEIKDFLDIDVSPQSMYYEGEDKYRALLDSVNKFKSMKDTMNMDAYAYTIKVRFNEYNKKHLKKFHAIIYNDVIRIFEKKPKYSKFSFLIDRVDLLTDFISFHKYCADKTFKFRNEIIQEIKEKIESFERKSKN